MVSVRPAIDADVDTLMGICSQMHADSHYAAITLDEAKLKGFLHGLIRSCHGLCLVGCHDDEIVAIFGARIDSYFFSQETIAVDYLLYILPDHRGTRLVMRLVQQYKLWAKQRGVSEMMLSSTTGFRMDKVEALYKRVGFEKVGVVFKQLKGE